MKSIDLSEVSALASYVQGADPEPLFLTQNGRTVAAVVPTDDENAESLLISVDPQFQAILERSQHRLEREGPISSAEVRKRLGI
ncbi:MAG: hypothetical protein L0228_04860 [Planctomycetes bacterium]|nr:hypothetical protein [Planctomycetota bacterium]